MTGSAAGLGAALARALLADGWAVTGVDRDGVETSRALPLRGRGAGAADGGGAATSEPCTHVRTDLSDPAAVDDLLDRLDTPFDLVILNAGVSATGRFEAIPADAHARLLAVNAEAPLVLADGLVSRGLLPDGAALVLVASLSVDVGYPGAASYAASKDAIAAYGRSIAKARKRLRVTTVHPGPIRTGHAARHAPPGAREAGRMDPDALARRILARAPKGGTLRPGPAAGLAGLAGRLVPGATARAMRRALFDRLDREVW